MTDSPPISPDLNWGLMVHEVSRLMRRRFEDEARHYGLTLPQWRTLVFIAKGRDQSQVGLAKALEIDPMTMSGILDRLEKRGLLVRYSAPNDSRAKLAELTPEGTRLAEDARNVGRSLLEKALAGVSAADRTALITALGCIRDNLASEPAAQKELVQ